MTRRIVKMIELAILEARIYKNMDNIESNISSIIREVNDLYFLGVIRDLSYVEKVHLHSRSILALREETAFSGKTRYKEGVAKSIKELEKLLKFTEVHMAVK